MGLKGSPTKVKATFTPKRTANCVNIEGVSPVEIADNLIGKLVEAKVL
jgi:electron transfer flavoprotein alpha/beta subunit